MAITVKQLKGTSSISGDRITLNDNFNIITDSVNQILNIINTTTGRIDNSTIGIDNTILTNGITVNGTGIDITSGNLTCAGNITLNDVNSFIQIGTTSRIQQSELPNIMMNNTIKLSLDNIGLFGLPRLTAAEIADIDTSLLVGGEMVYNIDTNTTMYYNNTTFV